MLLHAGFENYSACIKRVAHKDEQPENAERLMVLINDERGVLTQTSEFLNNPNYKIANQSKEVALADVFRVHDYNYLMKVIELTSKLSRSDNTVRIRLGKDFYDNNVLDRDTVLSKYTWQCSLLSSGAVIQAVD